MTRPPNPLLEIVKDCENYLGWLPEGPNPWRARAIAAVRLEKALAKADPPATARDLRLALNWCRRHRQPVKSPSHLLIHVATAREHAVVVEHVSPLAQRIQDAITWEQNQMHEDSSYWIGRLVRSSGSAREQTLAEWQQVRHG